MLSHNWQNLGTTVVLGNVWVGHEETQVMLEGPVYK